MLLYMASIYLMVFFSMNSMYSFYVELFSGFESAEKIAQDLVNLWALIYGSIGFASGLLAAYVTDKIGLILLCNRVLLPSVVFFLLTCSVANRYVFFFFSI